MGNKTKRKQLIIPVAIELTGITVVALGIGMELALGGDIYLVMITIGSCLIATGGVIWGKFMGGGK